GRVGVGAVGGQSQGQVLPADSQGQEAVAGRNGRLDQDEPGRGSDPQLSPGGGLAMTWSWFATRDSSPQTETNSGQTVHDELLFHFRSLVDEELAQDQPIGVAWQRAEARFGLLDQYARECHHISQRGRLMWQKLLTVGVVVLAFALGHL